MAALMARARESGWSVRPKSYPKTQSVDIGPGEVSKPFSVASDGFVWINISGQPSVASLTAEEREEFNSVIKSIDRNKKPESKPMVGISFKFIESKESQDRLLRLFELLDRATKRDHVIGLQPEGHLPL